MTEYRIKKGGREFTATRIDTLQQLAERGLLVPDDPVAVDGADYVPASEVPELAAVLEAAAHVTPPHDDPWRHWSDGHLDSEPVEETDEGILASFLGQLDSGIDPASSLPGAPRVAGPAPERPPEAAAPHVVRPEPDPPPKRDPRDTGLGTLSAVLSGGHRRAVPAEEHLPTVEPEPLPEPEEAPAEATSEPLPEPEPEPEPEVRTAPTLSTGEPPSPDADEGPSMPVTFTEWMKKREEGGHTSPLEGFGRYDDGIVVRRPSRREVNAFRVLLIVLAGAMLIGVRWLWVKTIAEASYPVEADVVRKADPPDPDPMRTVDAAGPSPDTGLSAEELARRALERKLRDRMGGHVLDFNTPEQLEDALFQELMNRGVPTRTVSVESLRERGTADVHNRRPTQAHLRIEVAGVSADETVGFEQLEERLMLCWLLVGKYQTLAKITFEDVVVRVAPPLPFERRYEGRRLAAYWAGQITAAELFLQE